MLVLAAAAALVDFLPLQANHYHLLLIPAVLAAAGVVVQAVEVLEPAALALVQMVLIHNLVRLP